MLNLLQMYGQYQNGPSKTKNNHKNNNHLIWFPIWILHLCNIFVNNYIMTVYEFVVTVRNDGRNLHDRPACHQYAHNTQSQRYGDLHVDREKRRNRQRLTVVNNSSYSIWTTWRALQTAINQLNQLLQASNQILLGKLASAASKYDDRAYCFLGRVVLCHNIQNPTYDELQGAEKKTALLYITYMFWDPTALHQIVSKQDGKNTACCWGLITAVKTHFHFSW